MPKARPPLPSIFFVRVSSRSSAFHAHGVRYLIVGGYAVIFHSQPLFTKDIDLFIQADPVNAQAIYASPLRRAMTKPPKRRKVRRHDNPGKGGPGK